MIKSYVRNENREPIGVIVALDRNLIGWSCKNPKDKWDKKKALKIAIGRALKVGLDHAYNVLHNIPVHMIDPFEEMEKRAERYFK